MREKCDSKEIYKKMKEIRKVKNCIQRKVDDHGRAITCINQ